MRRPQSSMPLGSSASGHHVQNRLARITATAPFNCCVLLLSEDRDGTQRTALDQPGFHIIRAASVPEAKRLFGRRPEISVVILDLETTGEDGPALAEIFRTEYPGRDWVEYLILSRSDAHITQPTGTRTSEVLSKPLGPGQLLTAVTESYNASRLRRLNHEERSSLEASVAEFQTRVGAAASQMLAHIRQSYGVISSSTSSTGKEEGAASHLLALISEEQVRARLRGKIFGSLAQNRASWMLLLVLSEAFQTEREVTIKSIAYHAGLPLSSALRRLNEMCSEGLAARWGDPNDARRSFVSLTPLGQSYFVRYESELRKAAAGKTR